MASTLDGQAIIWARFTIPSTGIPHLEAELSLQDGATSPTGTVTLLLEGAPYLVTITAGGSFVGKCRVSAVGGYNGWGRTIPAKGYGSPNGLAVAQLISDAARECGETPGVLPTSKVAGHYARREGAASAALKLAGQWWIDSAGLTQTGTRSTLPITDPELTVLDFDPADGELWLGVGDLTQYTPGRTVTSDVLPQTTVTLDLMTVHLKGSQLRVQTWIA